MKLPILIAVGLTALSSAVEAQETSPKAQASGLPKTMLLPTQVVSSLRQFLGRRPYDETADLISALEGCARVQIPVNGVTRSSGECPEVVEALRLQAEEVAKAKGEASAGKE